MNVSDFVNKRRMHFLASCTVQKARKLLHCSRLILRLLPLRLVVRSLWVPVLQPRVQQRLRGAGALLRVELLRTEWGRGEGERVRVRVGRAAAASGAALAQPGGWRRRGWECSRLASTHGHGVQQRGEPHKKMARATRLAGGQAGRHARRKGGSGRQALACSSALKKSSMSASAPGSRAARVVRLGCSHSYRLCRAVCVRVCAGGLQPLVPPLQGSVCARVCGCRTASAGQCVCARVRVGGCVAS